MRVTDHLSVGTNFTTGGLYDDWTIYVLDQQLFGLNSKSPNLPPPRYLPAWRKSLSDERGSPYGPSVLEAVILASVLLAALAILTLILMTVFGKRGDGLGDRGA